ncbi:MAG: hypothetical protein A3H32_11770 [Betaproteobacteria bacterium RIFCSPLOWO2_02_FULL_63_19]|nr:MAG: hypothetical protein A3H32_11770 [Betaproteobacteria bacterium RIFCSPLOWO2_02_FULL_63_19]
MNGVIRRNHYDVTDRVFVADPRVVCTEVCALLRSLEPNTDPRPVEQAFDVFSRLYAGTLPGYLGCETWYHDAQHSLDCALVMARLLDGHERGVPAAERLGERRARLGVIAALFHDAGYIRKSTDAEQHGAQFTLFHVRRSGDFLAEFLPSVGFVQEGPLTEQLVHFTGYEMALDDIQVRHPLDRRLGFMLGTADVLAQISDRCYLEKCRDFLYPEFEICGLAGTPRPDGTKPLYASREELLRRTPEFHDKIWKDRMDSYFECAYRYAATHFGGRNLYLEVIEGHLRRLREVLQANQIQEGLRRRAECINAGPLCVILGLQPAGDPGVRAASQPPSYKRRVHVGAVDPRNYVPT